MSIQIGAAWVGGRTADSVAAAESSGSYRPYAGPGRRRASYRSGAWSAGAAVSGTAMVTGLWTES